METDLSLFKQFEEQAERSTLRIYSWKQKCISLGYSQKVEKEIDLIKAKLLGWDVVKRPTGGGIVFHNEAEVTYSLVAAIDDPQLPKGLVASYKKISEAVIESLKSIGVSAGLRITDYGLRTPTLCFSYPAEYEIVVDGHKIVGSAQKRGRKALLQQGSIFVRRTEKSAFSVLKSPYDDINAISIEEILGREISFNSLSDALVDGFKEVLGIKFA